MLARIWTAIAALRADVRLLARLVEILLDRWTETETLTTAEACRYASVCDWTLRQWRKKGMLRGSGGRWNRRDLEVIVRAGVFRELGEGRVA